MNVPAKLKSADVTRFAQRAAQVESLKPAVAYWCYYWIVQQILKNNLHNADDATKAFTTKIVDKLEEMRLVYSGEDTITDDVAGQAYVEQFGMETFQRAENAMLADKASKQTAETFQAAATFLELMYIWGAPSKEIAAKIKYAKFHALRIAKAVKAGEDPNIGNPAPAPAPVTSANPLDPNDPEVRQINGTDGKSVAEGPASPDQMSEDVKAELTEAPVPQVSPSQQFRQVAKPRPGRGEIVWRPSGGYHPPKVTDEKDEAKTVEASVLPQRSEGKTSYASSTPLPEANQPTPFKDQNLNSPPVRAVSTTNAQPQYPTDTDSAGRQGSVGGGYFPQVAPSEGPVHTQQTIANLSGSASPRSQTQPSLSSLGPENLAAHQVGTPTSTVIQQVSASPSPAPLQHLHSQIAPQISRNAASWQSPSPLPAQSYQQSPVQPPAQSPQRPAVYQSISPPEFAPPQQLTQAPHPTHLQHPPSSTQSTFLPPGTALPQPTDLPHPTPSPQPAPFHQPMPVQPLGLSQSQQPDVVHWGTQSPQPTSSQQAAPPHQPDLSHQAAHYSQPASYHNPPQSILAQQSTISNRPESYLTDDIAVLEAQKHAKWAISALNFEDVPTAVKELREALKSLGAI